MAILSQISNTPTYYTGWYGTCENDGTEQCEPFVLVSGDTPATFAHAHDNIKAVFLVSSNREGSVSYNGNFPRFRLRFTSVKQLECGKCYTIIMKPGTGSLDIPEFTFANAQNDDPDQDLNNRITNRCYEPPPPPPPSPEPSPTPTPTPTTPPLPSPEPTPTPTPTPTLPQANLCEGFNHGVDVGPQEVVHQQVRFTSFPAGGHVCFSGATGGPPSNSMVRINGLPTPEGRMVVNGVLLNNGIKYITADGKIYQGTYRNNGPFTDLTLQ